MLPRDLHLSAMQIRVARHTRYVGETIQDPTGNDPFGMLGRLPVVLAWDAAVQAASALQRTS
jgi:hypothetical protein